MSEFNSTEFVDFIIENKIAGFFDKAITLKSGRTSHWYINWRNATNDVYLLDRLTDFLLSYIKTKKIALDCFYGVPEGATKTAVIAQYKWAKNQPGYKPGAFVLPMGRVKVKEHGSPEDKFFVGMPKGKTVVIEDVTTTGGSLIEAVGKLQEAEVQVVAMIGLSNRLEKPVDLKEGNSVEERLKKKFPTIAYYSMSSAREILPRAVKTLKPPPSIVQALNKEYEDYGVEPIRL